MSDTQTERPASAPIKMETLLIGVVVLIAVLGLMYLSSQRQQALRSSPSGLDGMQIWLKSEGISARSFTGGHLIDRESVGLLVLPVYDSRLDEDRPSPRTKQDLLMQQDEIDQRSAVLLRKAQQVPALIVLPKWRSGMRLTGLAHPLLLLEDTRLDALAKSLTADKAARLTYARAPFVELGYDGAPGKSLSARLYAAQLLDAPGCTPVIGQADAALLVECPLPTTGDAKKGETVLILSDPDLINNHGLRLGDNAWITARLIEARAGSNTVLIDYSREYWFAREKGQRSYERSWSDLLRFLAPPFTWLWIGAGIMMALTLWRAAVHFGARREDLETIGASKAVAINARARLMRLTGQDGALIRAYASSRLAAMAALLFGPAHARDYSERAAFLRFLARRHPDQAAALEQALARIDSLDPYSSAADAMRHVDDLEQILEQITDGT